MVASTFSTALGVFALGLIGAAQSHIMISKPVPFDQANLDNSPLAADGSNYPCKGSSYKITAMNKIPVNEPVLLDFKGTAVHGGGTCQLSISMDKEPTKDSTFKVIQTFVGGCPTIEGAGGLTFNIPKEFPSTDRATLAFTWFNRIGNREMYMNCAPVEITGGSDNMDFYQSLPDMFKANIGGSDFTTPESTDPEVPSPGAYVIQSSDAKPGPVSGGGAGSVSKNQVALIPNLAAYGGPAKDSNVISYADGSSAGNSGAAPSAPATGANNGQYTGNNGLYTPSQPSSAAMAPSQPTSSPVAQPSVPAAQPSTFQTLTVPATASTATAAYPTLSPAPNQGFAGSATTAPAPTGAPSSGGANCSTPGAIICNGPNQWGLCDNGKVAWQAVAAGTTCSNGAIQKRSAHVKRHAHGTRKHFVA